jgi:hypothetical protein
MATRESANPLKRVPIALARASLRDIVDGVNGVPERVKLTRYDRTIAGLVSAQDLRLLEECKEAMAEREHPAKKAAPGKRTHASKRRGKAAAK